MRSIKILFMLIVLLLPATGICFAEADPILVSEPNENVFACGEDVYIELLDAPIIAKQAFGRTAEENYMSFKVRMLFLADVAWEAIDKNSFSLIYEDAEGKETDYPLDYAISMLSNRRNGWNSLSSIVDYPAYFTMSLVFDVGSTEKESWTLVFRPTERGAEEPLCESLIPLNVK